MDSIIEKISKKSSEAWFDSIFTVNIKTGEVIIKQKDKYNILFGYENFPTMPKYISQERNHSFSKHIESIFLRSNKQFRKI